MMRKVLGCLLVGAVVVLWIAGRGLSQTGLCAGRSSSSCGRTTSGRVIRPIWPVSSGFQEGIARSVEVMVPCPWFNEVAQMLRENPGFDVGVHLT